MKPHILFALLQTLTLASYGQTNMAAVFYLHLGNGQAGSATRLLCTQVHFGEPIFVEAADLRYIRPWNNWKLTGSVDRQGTEIIADLVGSSASESQFYRGKVTLEHPFFARGGAASGFVGQQMWFIVTTNFESKSVLEKLQVAALPLKSGQ